MKKKLGKSGNPRITKHPRARITATISKENRDWLDSLGSEVSKSRVIDQALNFYRRKKK